jgi:nucleoside-diphosphate-sugar epimerase
MEKILITGSTGFIGSHVTEFFCKKGQQVRCFVRESSNLQLIKSLPVEIHFGDITEYNDLLKAVDGVDTIIHIAGVSNDWSKYDDFYNGNVVGTINVLKAAYNAGIKHTIVTGSISSYGEENTIKIKNEESPYCSHYNYFLDTVFPSRLNYYRDTKALSTREAIKFAGENGLNLTVLEPVWVYGEREFHTGFYDYLKTVKSGIPVLPGSVRNKFHVIYVKDLAFAYFQAFRAKPVGVERIIIGNLHPDKMEDILTLFCREINSKKPYNVPKWILYPFAFISELVYTCLGSSDPPFLTRGRLNMFYDNIEYSTSKAEKLLSFTSHHSIKDGIRKTVNWYRQNKLI